MKDRKYQEVLDIRMRRAMVLCDRKDWTELKRHCDILLKTYPEVSDIWYLLGVSEGNLGFPRKARVSFLRALQIAPERGDVAVDYIRSCLDSKLGQAASEGIEILFPRLSIDQQRETLALVCQGLRSREIEAHMLPPVVRELLAREAA